MRDQRKNNPQYAIRDRLQSRLNFALQNAGERKSESLEGYLGISCKDLANWIESQFVDGMSRVNKGTWNIDHIRPCASFDLTEDEQAKLCFNWRNLMPLDEFRNKSKQFEYEPHNELEWAEMVRELGYDGELFLIFEEGNGGL